MVRHLTKWKRRALFLPLLGILAGCSTNNYDYFGRPVLSTPYDGDRYQRVEEYLRRRGLTKPLPSSGSEAGPVLGPKLLK